MDKILYKKVLKKVKNLPSLSPVVDKVLIMVNEQNCNFNILGKEISSDPGLATAVLRVANSAYYGFSGRIKTMRDACFVIGLSGLHQIVVVAAANRYFPRENSAGLDHESVWKHGKLCGDIAGFIAMKLGYNQSDAVMSGLFHDVGKLVMDCYFPELYKDVLEYQKDKMVSFVEAEKKVLGFDHCMVGLMVADRWYLPQEILDAIGCHHLTTDNKPLYGDLINLADILALEFVPDLTIGKEALLVDEGVCARLGCSNNDLNMFRDELANIELG